MAAADPAPPDPELSAPVPGPALPEHVSLDPAPPGVPCPACGGERVRGVLAVRGIPLHSCVLLDDGAAARDFPRGDLLLAHCPDCAFLFNATFDPALVDYSEGYEETQGCSGTFNAWLAGVVEDLADLPGVRGGHVVEVGCGRGDFLEQLCRAADAHGVGVDPSSTAGRVDRDAGRGLAFLREEYGREHHDLALDLLACRHTLEHLGPVRAFARSVAGHLARRPDARVLIEVPDTLRILREGAFWDVYYEHASYFTAGSLGRLFTAEGLGPERLAPVYGDQYLHLLARRGPGSVPVPDDGPDVAAAVEAFRDACARSLGRWHAYLEAARAAGERVVLWGSGSKATGFLTTLGAGDGVAAVVDINPAKHGRFVAGTGHEIVAPERLRELRPDRVVVMNPIYLEEIGRDLSDLGLTPELVAV